MPQAKKRPAPAPLIWTQPTPPTHPRLNRDQIVSAAIAVADEGGVSALTMSAIARRLGPYTPMALYRHVPSKDALIDLMLDRVTGEIALSETRTSDWRGDLWAIAESSWEMVMRHTWYAQLVHARPPLGPNMLRRSEHILGVLTGEGAADAEAMTYASLLDRHVFGGALQAAGERDLRTRYALASTDDLAAAIGSARALVAGDEYPILSRWMASPTITSPEAQFELSLEFLLDGIAARLRDGQSRDS